MSLGYCDLPYGESYLYQADDEDEASCKHLCAKAQACSIVTFTVKTRKCVLLESCAADSWHSDDAHRTWEKVAPSYISGGFELSTSADGGSTWAASVM